MKMLNDIGIQYEEGFTEVRFGVFDRSCGTECFLFHRVSNGNTEATAVAEMLANVLRIMLQGNDEFAYTLIFQLHD